MYFFCHITWFWMLCVIPQIFPVWWLLSRNTGAIPHFTCQFVCFSFTCCSASKLIRCAYLKNKNTFQSLTFLNAFVLHACHQSEFAALYLSFVLGTKNAVEAGVCGCLYSMSIDLLYRKWTFIIAIDFSCLIREEINADYITSLTQDCK